MINVLKLRALGTSTGVIIPRDVLRRLNVKKGDSLHLVETADGYRLVANDPHAEKVAGAYQKIAARYRNALRRLAA